jgi:hypothetical protein
MKEDLFTAQFVAGNGGRGHLLGPATRERLAAVAREDAKANYPDQPLELGVHGVDRWPITSPSPGSIMTVDHGSYDIESAADPVRI